MSFLALLNSSQMFWRARSVQWAKNGHHHFFLVSLRSDRLQCSDLLDWPSPMVALYTLFKSCMLTNCLCFHPSSSLHTRTHLHLCTYIHKHTCKHMHSHVRIHICTHIYTHRHAHTTIFISIPTRKVRTEIMYKITVPSRPLCTSRGESSVFITMKHNVPSSS